MCWRFWYPSLHQTRAKISWGILLFKYQYYLTSVQFKFNIFVFLCCPTVNLFKIFPVFCMLFFTWHSWCRMSCTKLWATCFSMTHVNVLKIYALHSIECISHNTPSTHCYPLITHLKIISCSGTGKMKGIWAGSINWAHIIFPLLGSKEVLPAIQINSLFTIESIIWFWISGRKKIKFAYNPHILVHIVT